MEEKIDDAGEWPAYRPWPFTLERAGRCPDIEDAVEAVLSVPAHQKHREALKMILNAAVYFITDTETKEKAREYVGDLQRIQETMRIRALKISYSAASPDDLVAWAYTSIHRRFYLEPSPIDGWIYPLVPTGDLQTNWALVAVGIFLGSKQCYSDWKRLWWEIELGRGCWGEISKRMSKKTVGCAYMQIVYGSQVSQKRIFRELLKKAAAAGGPSLWLDPVEDQNIAEKESLAGKLIAEGFSEFEKSLEAGPYKVSRDILSGEFEHLSLQMKHALASAVRRATAAKRAAFKVVPYVEDRLQRREDIDRDQRQSEDEDKYEVSGEDAERVRRMSKYRPAGGPQDPQERRNAVLIDINVHEEALTKKYGRHGPAILRHFVERPQITESQLAAKLGISARQVRNVLRRIKAKRGLAREILAP